MDDELKPCPFCGSQPTIWGPKDYVAYRVEDEGGWLIICPGCPARVTTFSESTAIAAWNRRAEPAAAEADDTIDPAILPGLLRDHELRVEKLEGRVTVLENPPVLTATVALHSLDLDRLEARLATLEALAGYGQRAERGEGEARRG